MDAPFSRHRCPAAATLLCLLCLDACHASPAPQQVTDPHITAPTLQAAALACASRGFSYVAHVDGQRYYCTLTNPLNEPEAVAVAPLIEPSR